MNRFTCMLILLFASLVMPGQGLTAPAIEIEADKVEHDQEKGAIVYTGNVLISHGTLEIHAASLTVEQNADGGHVARVNGSPMTFSQHNAGKSISGQAMQASYDVDTEKLTLLSDAIVRQDGDTITSDRIIIDMKTGVATAGNKQSNSSRVHTVIKSRTDKVK